MFRSNLKEPFIANMNKMKILFPAAHNFLSEIGYNHIPGFWLSTATNAHLYYLDGFYMFIKPNITKLELDPNLNGRIERSTKNNSNLVFLEPIKFIIEKKNGFTNQWAEIAGMSKIVLTNKTPVVFFNELLQLIEKKHI